MPLMENISYYRDVLDKPDIYKELEKRNFKIKENKNFRWTNGEIDVYFNFDSMDIRLSRKYYIIPLELVTQRVIDNRFGKIE